VAYRLNEEKEKLLMVYLRKYGVAATIDFALFEVAGVNFKTDAVHASGDTVIMKDEGTEASTTNGFTDEGTGYSLVLTATEMEAARIVVYVVDQTATKVWLDRELIIETYAHSSAQHKANWDIGYPQGAVVTDGSNTSSTFKTDLAGGDDYVNRSYLLFTGGSLEGEQSKVSDFVNSTDFITVVDAFTAAPSAGDPFVIINR